MNIPFISKKENSASFTDGMKDFLSSLTNTRSARGRNSFVRTQVSEGELKAIYKSGTANKIFRLKTSAALSNSIIFETEEDEKFYTKKVEKAVKKACMFQLGFGRGIVVIHEYGAILSEPLRDGWNKKKFKLDVFSGDMVTASDVSTDLSNDRYYKPTFYVVRGHQVHYTRVADFTYVEPVEEESPSYRYGGISESELIYDQLVNDGVIERASASIVEKSSTFFYKIKDFKQNVMTGKAEGVLSYYREMENARSIYGAGIVDSEDDAFSVSQALSNLKEVDDVSLRRLAFVTGIPVSILVGDNNKGLGSSGDNDQKTFNDTIQSYQEFYIIDTLNELLEKLGLNPISFKEEQARTPLESANYDRIILENATMMVALGEDFETYLNDKGVTKKETFDNMFGDSED
jgi:hypothetical protein